MNCNEKPVAAIVVALAGLLVSSASCAEKDSLLAAQGPRADLAPAVKGIEDAEAGEVLDIGGRKVTIRKLDILPHVENDYTVRYVYDKYENPKLKELREKYKLDDVIAPGRNEFEKQVLLMAWVRAQFPFGRPPEEGNRNALKIMEYARQGKKGHCVQYGGLMVSASASLGWVNRLMCFPKHTYTEMWSNQYRKWVMFDPTRPGYAEVKGLPASAWELRQEWYVNGGKDLVWVWTKYGEPVKRVPAAESRLEGYFRNFRFLGYIPNTNLMDRGPMYGDKEFYIVRDEFTGDRQWHTRDNPKDPAKDCYWPINQTALSLVPNGQNLKVAIRTMTPNFMRFEVRTDGGTWRASDDSFIWSLHGGANRLEARSVNKFGVAGPVSTVALEVADG